MALKRRMTVSAWVHVDALDGDVLTKPMGGKLQAQFDKRLGMTPSGLRREVTGVNPDGTDKYSDFVAFEMDPEQAYSARLWLIGELIEDVRAKWEDGTDMVRSEELFEAIADDDDAFTQLVDGAKGHSERREEEAEKN